MKTIELQVPESMEMSDFDIAMTLAAKLFENGKLSAGQAADMVGITKRNFIESLGKYGVSPISTSLSDLASDIANA